MSTFGVRQNANFEIYMEIREMKDFKGWEKLWNWTLDFKDGGGRKRRDLEIILDFGNIWKIEKEKEEIR